MNCMLSYKSKELLLRDAIFIPSNLKCLCLMRLGIYFHVNYFLSYSVNIVFVNISFMFISFRYLNVAGKRILGHFKSFACPLLSSPRDDPPLE